MTLEEFGARLDKAKEHDFKGRRGYRARCPAHDDEHPSFAVWEGHDGWIHVKCQKGCSEASILSAMGLTDADRRMVPAQDVEYVYKDKDGKPIFKKVRYYKNGKKQFVQKGTSGERNLDHLGAAKKTLYNLPDVLKAVKDGTTIYVNEGEKACDEFTKRGLVATCQPEGGNMESPDRVWLPMHTNWLKGAKEVVVVRDKDATGRAYASYVASQLQGVGIDASIVESATEGDKDDAFDHFKAGKGVEDFVPVVEERQGLDIVVHDTEGFAAAEIKYLVEPYFPKGKMVLLDADGGVGKSSWVLSFAAAISRGQSPIGKMHGEAVKTLYLYQDSDSPEEYETVYRANGGIPGMIAFYNGHEMLTPGFADAVIETIKRGEFGIVVFDPLLYYFAGLTTNTDKAIDVLPGCRQANRIVEATGAVGIAVRHVTKGKKDKAASDLGMGSVQFRNSFRGQIVFRWHPTENGVVVATDEKGSLMVPRGPHFAFKRVDLRIDYLKIPNPFAKSSEPARDETPEPPRWAGLDEDPYA